MLNVGLIGLGPEWEHRFRPALAKLSPRMRVRCVHAPIASRAEQAASDLRCDVAHGLVSLIERDDVQALLVLDTAWYKSAPAQFACRAGKPAFLANRVAHHLGEADELLQRSAQTGVTLMPDFAHRYTPATSRLRELIATRLGQPQALVVDVAIAPGSGSAEPGAAESPVTDSARDALAVALDWSMNLVGAAPVAVRAGENCPSAERRELHVEFRRPPTGKAAPAALVRLSEKPAASSANGPDFSLVVRASVECLHGTAKLEGPHDMTWDLAGERFVESLTSDQPAVEVLLDHFCRRVMGGLIPVPTLDDLSRAFSLVDSALPP